MGGRSQIGVGLGVGAGIPILAAFAAIGYLLFRAACRRRMRLSQIWMIG
jgi:hypothetical protein